VRSSEDDAARIDHGNALLGRQVKDRNDPGVTVADANEYGSPKGRFTNARHGVTLLRGRALEPRGRTACVPVALAAAAVEAGIVSTGC